MQAQNQIQQQPRPSDDVWDGVMELPCLEDLGKHKTDLQGNDGSSASFPDDLVVGIATPFSIQEPSNVHEESPCNPQGNLPFPAVVDLLKTTDRTDATRAEELKVIKFVVRRETEKQKKIGHLISYQRRENGAYDEDCGSDRESDSESDFESEPMDSEKEQEVAPRPFTAKKGCAAITQAIEQANSKPDTAAIKKAPAQALKAPRWANTNTVPFAPLPATVEEFPLLRDIIATLPANLQYVPELIAKIGMAGLRQRNDISNKPGHKEFGTRVAEVYQPLYELIKQGKMTHKQAIDILSCVYPKWAPRFNTKDFGTKIYRGLTLKDYIVRGALPEERSKPGQSTEIHQSPKDNSNLYNEVAAYLAQHPEAKPSEIERQLDLYHGTAYNWYNKLCGKPAKKQNKTRRGCGHGRAARK